MKLFSTAVNFFTNKVFRFLSISAISMLTLGSVFYHFAEKWTWLDSIYFSVITLTTVGYGDISPQTSIGKIFTIFYILTGLGIMLGFINEIHDTQKKVRSKIMKKK